MDSEELASGISDYATCPNMPTLGGAWMEKGACKLAKKILKYYKFIKI